MTTREAVLLVLVLVLAVALATAIALRIWRPRPRAKSSRRLLVPFTGGGLDPTVLEAAIRLARADEATLVPAYLLVVPWSYGEDSPLADEVAVALPLLEAVEHAALRAGVPVDARIEKGRSATHALQRLLETEEFDRVLAPAPPLANGHPAGFSPKELTWILTRVPSEMLVLKPAPTEELAPA